MRLAAWRVALRIARRDALRAKGRSALVIAMIAVPVLGVATADITYRSAELSAQQSADRRMGASVAYVSANEVGVPLLQGPDPDQGTSQDDQKLTAEQKARTRQPVDQLLKQALPPGAGTVVFDQGSFTRVSTKYGVTDAEVSGLDLSDPVFRGMVTLRQGTLPNAPFQVAATSAFLSDSGLHLGSTTTVSGSTQPLTITAAIEFPDDLRSDRLVGRPQDLASVLPKQSTDHNYSGDWLVTLPGGAAFSWADVQRTNLFGFSVASRAVLADPPPDSEVPYYANGNGGGGGGLNSEAVTVVATVVGMALLEIVLLAGPAFAVGARRSRRQLGLLAAAGGNRSHIRNVVLGGGVVLGATGALIGIVVAAAAVAIGRGALEDLVGKRFGGFTLQPLDLVGIVAVGLVTGLLAAVVPAVQASRQNVLASLTGRGDVRAPSKKLTVIGALVVALGTALALLGASVGGQTAAIMGGSMIAELGLVACIPFLVGLFGRLSRWLPLGPRLALRDSTRHRGRTAPAVAAVMAAVAGAIAVTAYQGSSDVEYRAEYQASAPRNAVVLQPESTNGVVPGTADRTGALARQSAAVEQSIAGLGPRGDVYAVGVSGADCLGDHDCGYVGTVLPADRVCPIDALDAKGSPAKTYSSAEIRAMVKDDPRCRQNRYAVSYSYFGSVAAGDATVLRNLGGSSDPAAVAALAAGKVLVADPRYVENGKVALSVEVTGNSPASGGAGTDSSRTINAPAVSYHAVAGSPGALMSPATARALGLTAAPAGSVWLPDRATDSAAQQRASAAVTRIGDATVNVERGYQGTNSAIAIILALVASVVAVAAAGIATGLAAADSQADLATLAAVGAAPRIRRTLSGFQCAVIATMGAILGAAAGLVPAAALWGVHASTMATTYSASDGSVSIGAPTTPLDVPWGTMALVVVGLPLMAWLLAAGFTRSRVVLTRRTG
ncbi:FtsX-like permease family protein [Streptacidiphilus sp. N1-3]|uniref:FtsX-like permease family protein n=1 Tax=Streptacidiphilus alkalitolerans TaxID=3342712 RepID=A0ABV6X3L0_9ACTN